MAAGRRETRAALLAGTLELSPSDEHKSEKNYEYMFTLQSLPFSFFLFLGQQNSNHGETTMIKKYTPWGFKAANITQHTVSSPSDLHNFLSTAKQAFQNFLVQWRMRN